MNGTLASPAGDIGIGTTTPGAKLEVVGQVKITGGTPGLYKVLTSDAAGLATWQTPTSLPCTVPGGIISNTCLGLGALGNNTTGSHNSAF